MSKKKLKQEVQSLKARIADSLEPYVVAVELELQALNYDDAVSIVERELLKNPFISYHTVTEPVD